MSTPIPGGKSEFRKRAGGNVQHQRHSSSSSLPRPGLGHPSPRTPAAPPLSGSPKQGKYVGAVPSMPPPFPVEQRSASFTSFTSQSSTGSLGYGQQQQQQQHQQQQQNSNNNDPRGSVSRSASYVASTNNNNAAYGSATAAAAAQLGGGGTNSTASGAGSYSGGGYGGMNGYSNGGMSSQHQQHQAQAQAQRRVSDNKYNKPNKRNRGSSSGVGMMIGCILLFVYSIIITAMYFSNNGATTTLLKQLDLSDTQMVVTKVEELQRKLQASESNRQRIERNTQSKSSSRINQLERENRLLEEERNKLKDVHVPEANEKLKTFGNREDAFADQIGWLMDSTRRESKRMVLERFGPGPHKVAMTFAVNIEPDGNEKNKDETTEIKKKYYKFVIELAPLELVPHAIHLFLEQVDHGLMEGTSFYLNGPHIVQAGPQPKWDDYYDGSDDELFNTMDGSDGHKKHVISSSAVNTIKKYENKVQSSQNEEHDDDEYEQSLDDFKNEASRTHRYSELGLDQLAFPDYHPDYPHTPWTVGFTGRPGGPDWYINKVDNTEGHGPGGQYQYMLKEQGDSCFGTISAEGSGRNALAGYVYQADTTADNSEWHHFLVTPVEIVEAIIMTKEPLLDHHLHLDENHMDSHKIYHNIPRKTEQGQEARKLRLAAEERRDQVAAVQAREKEEAEQQQQRQRQHDEWEQHTREQQKRDLEAEQQARGEEGRQELEQQQQRELEQHQRWEQHQQREREQREREQREREQREREQREREQRDRREPDIDSLREKRDAFSINKMNRPRIPNMDGATEA